MTLKGFNEIAKVYTKKINDWYYTADGQISETKKDNWLIETDGIALGKVLTVEHVDHTRTLSNSVIEVFNVLGIEAARQSLIKEIWDVLGHYSIYVNYRHISTLCDMMTQRGTLTSITRHGINWGEIGPLRKCSFEETVEILLEAAAFSESDTL